MKNDKFIALLVIWLFCLIAAQAQPQDTPFLERTITVSLSEERLDDALKKISQQAGLTFSYNPAIFDGSKIVHHNFVNKTVREILDQLFNGTIQYKARGKYIILTKTEISSSHEKPQIYSGYVVDEATGERLRDVSIYDPVTLSSTVTDSYGYFEIEISKPPEDLRLAINKQNYTDTLVVPHAQGRLLNIPLKINTGKINTFADSVSEKFKRIWHKVFAKQQVNMANIKDTINRKTQISFVPFIGTNHALSGNIINDYSLNVIGGYSRGVRKLELGGAFNIVSGNMHGAQFAGVFNAVGGNVKGAQLAGVFNANYGETKGAQLAGVFNFNWGGIQDFAAAGVFNFSRQDSRAVQLAGVSNFTIGDQSSPHLAGLFNFSTRDVASQFSGLFNFSGRDMKGWQASGLWNFSGRDVRGVQAAGVLNVAGREMRGLQIGGIFNYATKVRGVQLGLLNMADSIQGVPIGLLSLVLKGYHKLEVSADEIFYTNVAFRTGVRQFYNIITAGAKPRTFKDNATFWTFGYGLGTAPKLSRKLYLNFDITSNQIVYGNSFEALNLLNKAYVGIDFQIFKKMSVTAGATLNAQVTEADYEGYQNLFSHYQPDVFYDRTYNNDLNIRMWMGGKIGLRFL